MSRRFNPVHENTSGVLETLADLVSINSVNPEWGGPGESDLSDYVVGFFEGCNVECWTEEVLPGRHNAYVRLAGQNERRRVILEAHMDTVSADGMTVAPFAPLVENGLLSGRGACDIKGGLAAMMHAVRDVQLSGESPPCEVLLAAVVDEEYLYRGVLKLIDQLSPASSDQETITVVAEPTDCQIAVANKGVLRWRIVTNGKTAHSSRPHLGRNAILDMMDVIRLIQRDAELLASQKHTLVGSPTVCISMIEGGQQINFVPDRCCISIDRRLIPGEDPNAVLKRYESMLRKQCDAQIEFETPMLLDAAFETAVSSPVVQTAMKVAKDNGTCSTPCGVSFGCDITKLTRAGIPGIIYGPGNIDQAHTANEFVELEQVIQAKEFYQAFLMEYGK